MEQPSKLPPDDFPLLRGVEDKCEKLTAYKIFGSLDWEAHSRVPAPLTYPRGKEDTQWIEILSNIIAEKFTSQT